MAYSTTVFNVFITSPSDVTKERELVRQVVAEWNTINARTHGIILQPIGWETDVYPSLGVSAQAAVNEQLLKDADLLIGVFWTRIGTPTEKYESGSVEEIKRHHAAGKPSMLYFSSQPVSLDSVDQEQYGKLMEFKKWCLHKGIIESFSSVTEFVEKLHRQLGLRVNSDEYFTRHLNEASKSTSPSLEPAERSIPSHLSEESKLLLKEAAKDNAGSIMRVNLISGLIVQTNGKNFGSDKRNPRLDASLEAALTSLENEGLVEAGNYKREVFRVTAKGYRVADMI
jgi:hypothetical protein